MKKTIFTFCSIAIVSCAIFFACAKDDNSITHVTYAAQTSGGTGNNPNPNGLPSNSGYGTTTATTAGSTTSGSTTGSTPTVYSATVTLPSGPMSGTVSSISCGSTMYGNCSNTQIGMIAVQFASAPAAGTYNIVSSNPGASDVVVSYNGNNYGSSGTVTVAVVGGKNVVTFNSVTGTTSTSVTFTLTGSFSCP